MDASAFFLLIRFLYVKDQVNEYTKDFFGLVLSFVFNVYQCFFSLAVNLRGSFNTENTTFYGSSNLSNDLYLQFWSLQSLFSNPAICFEKMNEHTLPHYCTTMDLVIKLFNDNIVTSQKTKNETNIQSDITSHEIEEFFFFPKFLTNSALFDLQVGA